MNPAACMSVLFGPAAYQRKQTIALLAMRSLHAELRLYPKPGLVSHRDSGAHRDMDANIFVRSLFSLRHYFAEIAAAGIREARLSELQQIGLKAERRMLGSTKGVNTHRGAIFTLGLLATAAGCAWAWDVACSDETLRDIVVTRWGRDLRLGVVSHDLAPSHGRQVAAKFDVTGARGEAVHGFPAVFDRGLPQLRLALSKGAGQDEALIHTFFSLLADVADTNVPAVLATRSRGIYSQRQCVCRGLVWPSRITSSSVYQTKFVAGGVCRPACGNLVCASVAM